MFPETYSPTLPYLEIPPPPHLRDYVACLWQSSSPDQTRHTSVLPDGCIDLIWRTDGEPFIAGPMTRPVSATTAPGIATLGVRFQPGVATALLGVSAAELRDLAVPLSDLWSGARLQEARERALRVGDVFTPGLAAATVTSLVHEARPPDPFVRDACRWFARHPGEPTIRFIAGSGVSERHARRRFIEHVGYGPKTLQRILRMQRVLWLLSQAEPPLTLARLAILAGYADQAHLTREVRALTGQLPTALAGNHPRSAVADLFKTPIS